MTNLVRTAGCGSTTVVTDAGAAVEYEGVVVVSLSTDLLGDARRIVWRSDVEDLYVPVLRLHAGSIIVEVGFLPDGGHGHLGLADGRRSHGVEGLRCHPDGLPGGHVVAEHALGRLDFAGGERRLVDAAVKEDDAVAAPAGPAAVPDEDLAPQAALRLPVHVHDDDVRLEALDLAGPPVELEVGHRHHLPGRRHRRAQIILICRTGREQTRDYDR